MASEAPKMAVRGNMHMNIRVFEVADFNLVVKNDIRVQVDLRGHLDAAMASEATRGNMHMNIRVLEVTCFKSEVKFDLRNN